MMTHEEALQLLSARVDGELTPEQEQLLDAWLREHPDGRVIAEAFQSQDAETRHVFEPRRTAALRTAQLVAEQIVTPPAPAAPAQPRPKRSRFWAIAPPFAAAVVLAFVGFYWLRPHSTGPAPMLVNKETNSASTLTELLTPRARPAAPKAAVAAVGDKMSTKAGEKSRTTLPDGSVLYLNQNTNVELAANRLVKLERGEIFVEAVPADETAGRSVFEVETAERKLSALGTKFSVDAVGKALSVVVTQGSVQVDGAEQAVKSGQELRMKDGEPTAVAAAKLASYELDWTRELMIAADSPLVPAGRYDGGALVAVDPYGQEAKLSLVNYHIDVHIEDGFARTTIDQTYFNDENFQMEGTFYFPLPPDASLSRLAMYVANGDTCMLMEGGMAERDYARQTYERIRTARRDPALLEWVDGSLFKMRVFPLEARQEKRIILSYSQKLPVQYGRTTYRFPAGHSLNIVKHWSFAATVKGGAAVSAASPSHPGMKIEQAGNDLVLTDKSEQLKVDRDVVLELQDSKVAQQGESVRWSSTEHEGAKYLMLRYRPELQGAPRRERRDWVFLFEASGARDPLIARAQIEVIRALLNQAEHDDTFALLTVGTHIHKFSEQPLRVTAENVENALAFLGKTHLIGALNLEQAIIEAEPYLAAGSNPHLVHVGGGVATLGEQRADRLISRIPRTRYVGVAVGKRFSPAFMKTAAEKTGGFFTTINPDEPITWRGFELAATLNTPRLLNVALSVPAARAPFARFLPFTNALAQGEELAAVARIDGDVPASVTIRGSVDGAPFERTIDIKDVAANADYLPRTWAKLEIDRLLAEDAGTYRQRIVDLSKAMYVMTPFTSLLVLENEAMYKEFKVDRGRKDHWAMYRCPEKIPTVYIPDPNQPAAPNAVKMVNQKPHANQVRQTILTRAGPQYLPPIESVNQGLGIPVMFGAVAGLAAASSPATPTDSPTMPTGSGFAGGVGGGAIAANGALQSSDGLALGFNLERKSLDSFWLDSSVSSDSGLSRLGAFNKQFGFEFAYQIPSLLEKQLAPEAEGRGKIDKLAENERLLEETGEFLGRRVRLRSLDLNQPVSSRFFANVVPAREANLGDQPVELGQLSLDLYDLSESLPPPTGSVKLRDSDKDSKTTYEWKYAGEESRGRGVAPWGVTGHYLAQGQLSLNTALGAEIFEPSDLEFFLERQKVDKWQDRAAGNDDIALRKLRDSYGAIPEITEMKRRTRDLLRVPSQAPPYYNRPSFNNQDRIFTDLASYAPGMSSSVADIEAVIEAEAAPRSGLRRGSIDPAARKRVEAARTAAWRTLAFKDETGAQCQFNHDGQGRYAYEHRTGFGLIERVICDGSTILHLYPELGIGARRNVSRFHRAELCRLLPDVLPAVDDLNFGCDVKLIDENTVALVSLPHVGDDAKANAMWIELHLVFEGNRVAQRRWVLKTGKSETYPADKNFALGKAPAAQPTAAGTSAMGGGVGAGLKDVASSDLKKAAGAQAKGAAGPEATEVDGATVKELARVLYEADGTIRFLDFKGQELINAKRAIKPATQPDLKPDVTSLVVLPLPLRSRETVYRKHDLDPNRSLFDGENACFECLAAEAALELFACEFAANNHNQAEDIWHHCFAKHSDERTGFLTLLLSTGQEPQDRFKSAVHALAKKMVDNKTVSPLMRYLSLAVDPDAIYWQRQLGVMPGPAPATDFLSNLLVFRSLVVRWQGDAVNDRFLGQRAAERERALAFVRQHAGDVWGWCTLGIVADKAGSPEFRQQIAATWTELAVKSGLTYHARYEQAVNLLLANKRVEARDCFRRLFQEALKIGILPPLDHRFRDAFTVATDGAQWRALMHEAADKCVAAKNRPAVVLLAWQCRQLGDQALSDELLELALKEKADNWESVVTRLTAVEYLWSINAAEQADRLVSDLLMLPALQNESQIWRLAAKIAERRGERLRQFDCLEKALDLEYRHVPALFNIEPIRNDYGNLLRHYEWLAEASRQLNAPLPPDLIARTVRAADRWRSLDPEANSACELAAKVLRMIGGAQAEALAWDFATTPLAMRPNESEPWLSMAQSAMQEGNLVLADQCYEAAFAAEPTNAQILWDRSRLLERRGETSHSREVLQQIAAGDWQPRFEGLKTQARQIVEGR